MTSFSLDLDELAGAIAQLHLDVDAHEFHGGICGLLCTNGPGAVGRWLRLAGRDALSSFGDSGVALEKLHEAEAETWRALTAESFDFELLLPDESCDLGERVEALAVWCHGFVTGIGLGGYSSEHPGPGDRPQIAEILSDLAAISQAGLSDEDLGDVRSADFDFAAISEHARVAVQLLFESLRAASDAEQAIEPMLTTH